MPTPTSTSLRLVPGSRLPARSDKFFRRCGLRAALEPGGIAPVVLNAANEIAVAAFLEKRMRFTAITDIIERALAAVPGASLTSIEQCVTVDADARRCAKAFVDAGVGRR